MKGCPTETQPELQITTSGQWEDGTSHLLAPLVAWCLVECEKDLNKDIVTSD